MVEVREDNHPQITQMEFNEFNLCNLWMIWFFLTLTSPAVASRALF
jgi:hypothetical protein